MEQQLLFKTKALDDNIKSITIDEVDYKINFSSKIPNELKLSPQTVKNSIYLIDVHFSYEDQKLQEQPGVDFYRHLLKLYETIPNGLDNLKVVFYSPLPKNYLVEYKPENYVLNVFPFIQTDPDGNFSKNLIELVEKYNSDNSWPVFNIASENLLSGWSLAAEDYKKKNTNWKPENLKISIPDGKTHLFIDDEFNQWYQTHKVIFNNFQNQILYLKKDGQSITQKEFRDSWEITRDKILTLSKEADYITSDFYLTENHKDTKYFKKSEEIKTISGFNLILEIFKKQPWKPYTMFTSSNKIWNYEFFEANGCWNWCVKDYRLKISQEEKKQEYFFFKDNIESIYNEFWQNAQNLWSFWSSTFKSRPYLIPREKDFLRKTLLDCFHRLRNEETKRAIRTNKGVISNYSSNHVYAGISVSLSGYFDNYFKRLGKTNGNNNLIEALYFIRSYFAHGTNYYLAKKEDALIALIIFVDHIVNEEPNINPDDKIAIKGAEHFNNQQVFFYYQLIQNISFDDSFTLNLLKSHLKNYTDVQKLRELESSLKKIISKCDYRLKAKGLLQSEKNKIETYKEDLTKFTNMIYNEINHK